MASAHVVPNGDVWNLKGDGRVVSTHETQIAAIAAGRRWLSENHGGELNIHSQGGAIRAKDTIHPGNDPRGNG